MTTEEDGAVPMMLERACMRGLETKRRRRDEMWWFGMLNWKELIMGEKQWVWDTEGYKLENSEKRVLLKTAHCRKKGMELGKERMRLLKRKTLSYVRWTVCACY